MIDPGEAGAKKTFAEFDRLVGREQLVALHLNDSKTGLGSRVDRHEHIGKGRIGLEAFRYIMTATRFKKVPVGAAPGLQFRIHTRSPRSIRIMSLFCGDSHGPVCGQSPTLNFGIPSTAKNLSFLSLSFSLFVSLFVGSRSF